MSKGYWFLILVLAGLLAACQAQPAANPTAPVASPFNTQPTETLPAVPPTLEIVSTPTRKPSPTPKSSPSPTPSPIPVEAEACFVSYPVPVAFFPDGKRILLRGDLGVQVFNLETMQVESEIANPPEARLTAVTLSPNGEMVAWSLDDFSIQLVRITDQQVLATLQGHTNVVGKLLFAPDGERLYSASHDSWIKVWDQEGSEVSAFQPTGADDFPSEVAGLGISADGSRLATLPYNGPVKLWSLPDFTLIRALGANGGYDYSDASFSPDGRRVAADTVNGMFLWETATGKELLGGNPGINSAAVTYSPDGRYLAYGLVDQSYHIVLAQPDGSLLASGGVELNIWRVEDGALLAVGKSDCQ